VAAHFYDILLLRLSHFKRNTFSNPRDFRKEAVLEIPEHKADAKDRAAETGKPVGVPASKG
jgi:hypothetical protein